MTGILIPQINATLTRQASGQIVSPQCGSDLDVEVDDSVVKFCPVFRQTRYGQGLQRLSLCALVTGRS
jgi:hypothetical protein